jgi:BirA family biotin operon repressor/biotin-[acetyl-CoA-carboxylase] ligase
VTAYSELVALLSAREYRSGQQLARRLCVSRAAIWKGVQRLRGWGLAVESRPGAGYRLPYPVRPLELGRLRAGLSARGAGLDVTLLPHVDSTSSWLAEGPPVSVPRACVAEAQSAGRGRRGRAWQSPFGLNLYVSLDWPLRELPGVTGMLSLAAAAALAEALRELGVGSGLAVKWPNDIWYGERKLAGVLLELSGEPAGPCRVIVGVGLNVHMSDLRPDIDQPWTDLSTALGGVRVDRSDLAARVLAALSAVMAQAEADTLASWIDSWAALDALRGRRVRLEQGAGPGLEGVARGIDDSGRLLLERDGRLERYFSGEVSLRATEA